MNLVSTYFLGYALTILGFILFLMSIFVIRQHMHSTKVQAPPPKDGESQPDSSNPFRAVMHHEQKSDVVDGDT
jgi:hypothetical protein